MDSAQTVAAPSPALMGDPDPDGDIKLLLGPSQTPIRVSSKILSLTSPVFRAMLDPRFLSRPPSYQDLPEIALPEDDPAAMSWMCSAVHFHDLGDKASLSTLKRVAIVCDKYDVSAALRPWSSMWLRRSIPDPSKTTGSWELMWIAIAFDDQDLFTLATKSFVWNTPAEVQQGSVPLDDPDATGIALLPERLPGKSLSLCALTTTCCRKDLTNTCPDALRSLKQEIACRFSTQIEELVRPQLYWSSCRTEGCGHPILSHFFIELDRIGAWPLYARITKEGLAKAAASLRDFNNYSFLRIRPCDCLGHVDFKMVIGEVIDQIEGEPRQLCLNCVKSGVVAIQEGNCGAETRSGCKLKAS